MYADRVVRELGVFPRTAAFIVKLYADSEGYDTRAEGNQAELWAERFLALPVSDQLHWKRKGVERVAAIDEAYNARITPKP